jgi:hypothetical protein
MMAFTSIAKHAFHATRKGTPKGERSDWHRICDECGEGPDHPVHVVSRAEEEKTLLRVMEEEPLKHWKAGPAIGG